MFLFSLYHVVVSWYISVFFFFFFLLLFLLFFFFFFFQAEDGIRDWSVTGVQTCALPIYPGLGRTGPMFPITGSTITAASSCVWSSMILLLIPSSLNFATSVSSATFLVMPSELGMPKLDAPDPALTKTLSWAP